MAKISTLKFSDIRIDPGIQSRVEIDQTAVRRYAVAMREGLWNWKARELPIVYHDGQAYWLASGFHRFEAAKQTRMRVLPCEIRTGTRRDAIFISTRSNQDHGLYRSNEDKYRSVLLVLQDEEWRQWSDRKVGRHCGVSQRFASKVRTENGFQLDGPRTYERNGQIQRMDTSKITESNAARASVPTGQIVQTPDDQNLPAWWSQIDADCFYHMYDQTKEIYVDDEFIFEENAVEFAGNNPLITVRSGAEILADPDLYRDYEDAVADPDGTRPTAADPVPAAVTEPEADQSVVDSTTPAESDRRVNPETGEITYSDPTPEAAALPLDETKIFLPPLYYAVDSKEKQILYPGEKEYNDLRRLYPERTRYYIYKYDAILRLRKNTLADYALIAFDVDADPDDAPADLPPVTPVDGAELTYAHINHHLWYGIRGDELLVAGYASKDAARAAYPGLEVGIWQGEDILKKRERGQIYSLVRAFRSAVCAHDFDPAGTYLFDRETHRLFTVRFADATAAKHDDRADAAWETETGAAIKKAWAWRFWNYTLLPLPGTYATQAADDTPLSRWEAFAQALSKLADTQVPESVPGPADLARIEQYTLKQIQLLFQNKCGGTIVALVEELTGQKLLAPIPLPTHLDMRIRAEITDRHIGPAPKTFHWDIAAGRVRSTSEQAQDQAAYVIAALGGYQLQRLQAAATQHVAGQPV